MMLEKIIGDYSVESIEAIVKKVTEDRCIAIFTDYIYSISGNNPDMSKIEKEFIIKLEGKLVSLATDLYMNELTSKEPLENNIVMDRLKFMLQDGHWGYSERDSGELCELISTYEDEVAYPYIKACMLDCLNEMYENERTKKEKEKEARIKSLEAKIQNYNESIVKFEAELEDLKA